MSIPHAIPPSTAPSIPWVVSAKCPRCRSPLVLRHDRAYQHFIACLNHPKCKFISDYSRLIHCLLDKIIELQDQMEDAGFMVERTLP
jgi:ssDNA-binding Zn-finger/Zn-ribbon topoisomerase 1